MKRLNKKDWALIAEAIDMLLTDYEDDTHPHHVRLEELQQYATDHADFSEFKGESES